MPCLTGSVSSSRLWRTDPLLSRILQPLSVSLNVQNTSMNLAGNPVEEKHAWLTRTIVWSRNWCGALVSLALWLPQSVRRSEEDSDFVGHSERAHGGGELLHLEGAASPGASLGHCLVAHQGSRWREENAEHHVENAADCLGRHFSTLTMSTSS